MTERQTKMTKMTQWRRFEGRKLSGKCARKLRRTRMPSGAYYVRAERAVLGNSSGEGNGVVNEQPLSLLLQHGGSAS